MDYDKGQDVIITILEVTTSILNRLSKRDEDLDLGLLRERFTPEQVIGALAFAAHLTDRAEPASVRELVQDFDWSRIPRHELCLPPMFR